MKISNRNFGDILRKDTTSEILHPNIPYRYFQSIENLTE